ncbi:hypothetical protein ACHAWX_001008, partial [Stephanocyclus meneghinianus]
VLHHWKLETMPSSKPSSTNTESPGKGLIFDRSSQGHDLLQEWPHNNVASHDTREKVTFAEYSVMRLYNNDKSYQSKKSYTAAEVKNFRDQAALDASRVRNIISTHSLQNGHALNHAVDLGLVKHEEILGIEHRLSEKTAANALYERRAHVALTLRAQEVMRRKCGNAVDHVMLAKVASMSSSRSGNRARIIRSCLTNG